MARVEISLHFKLYDKRRDNPRLANEHNFPPRDSILSDDSKYSVLKSQMYRYDRNTSFAADFIANVVLLARRMSDAGYKRQRLLGQIRSYRAWDKSKGTWGVVKRRIIEEVRR